MRDGDHKFGQGTNTVNALRDAETNLAVEGSKYHSEIFAGDEGGTCPSNVAGILVETSGMHQKHVDRVARTF